MYDLLPLFVAILPIASVAAVLRFRGVHRPALSDTGTEHRSDIWRDYDMRKRDERHAALELYYGLYGPMPLDTE